MNGKRREENDDGGGGRTYDIIFTTSAANRKRCKCYEDQKERHAGNAGHIDGVIERFSLTVDVGQISDTERICWEDENLYRVKDGESTELHFMFVRDDTSILEGGKWYVVNGVVNHSGSISVGTGGAANLVLLEGAALTVDSHSKSGTPGIELPAGCSLNIFGTSGGALNARSGKNAAGIGGGDSQGAGMLMVYGGRVTATGGLVWRGHRRRQRQDDGVRIAAEEFGGQGCLLRGMRRFGRFGWFGRFGSLWDE